MQNWMFWSIILTVTALTIGPIVWNYFKDRALDARGVVTRAVIEALEDTGSRVNANPVIRLRLKVMPDQAPAYAAETKLALSAVQLTRLPPGTEVQVKVDPKDPLQVLFKPER